MIRRSTQKRQFLVRKIAALIFGGTALSATIAPAALPGSFWWDVDSSIAGAGGATPSGTWSTGGTTWSNNANGTVATPAYTTVATNDLNFSAGVNATGAYTITLNDAQAAKSLNFQEGTATISGAGGIINLGGTGLINVNNGAAAVIGGNTSTILGGTAGLTKTGVGTLTLNGTDANTFTGGLKVNGGTLALSFANMATPTNLLDSTNTLSFGGGGIAITSKNTAVTAQTLGNVTINSGGGRLLANPNGGSDTNITLGSLTATASGGSFLVGRSTASGTGNLNITTTSNVDATGTYGGRVVFANGTANTGYDWAANTGGGGPYTFAAYTGYTAMATSGTDTNNSRITAGTALTGNLTTNSLKFENPATAQTLDLGAGNTLTLDNGGLLFTGASVAQGPRIMNGTITAGNGSGSYDLVVHTYNATAQNIAVGTTGANLALVNTISSVIADNGSNPVTLVKNGPGNLLISGTNTFTGGIVVNEGNLAFNSAGAQNDNPLTFNANSILSTFNPTTSTASSITLNNNSQVTILNNNSSYTVNGQVTGTGGLSVAQGGQGSITLNLNATNNNFTGPLRFTHNNNTQSATINVNSLADTSTVGEGNITFGASANSISHNFGLGAGTVAPITLNNRRFELAGAQVNQQINNASSQAFTINTDLLISGNAAKNLVLGGGGAGISTLNGAITNSATPTAAGTVPLGVRTTAAGGSLTLGSVEGISVGAMITGTGIAAGTTITAINPTTRVVTLSQNTTGGIALGTNFTIPGVVNSVSLTKSGTSTWVLGGVNTYTGGTNLSAGTLQFSTLEAMPATGNVAAATNTTLAVNVGDTGEWTTGTSGNGTIGGLLAGLGGQAGSTVSYTGNVTLGIDTSNAGSVQTYSGNLANVATSLGIRKMGTGTLELSGTHTYTGNTTVAGGTLNITGTLTGNTTTSTLALAGTAANSVTNVSNNVTQFAITGATVAGNNLAYNQTAGTVDLASGLTIVPAAATTGSGAFNLTGGTLNINSGNFLLINDASGSASGYVGGTGTLNFANTSANGGVAWAGTGILTIGPGGNVNRATGTNAFYLTAFANATGTLNITGGNFDLGTGSLRMGNGAAIAGINGFVNLASGTLTMGANFTNSALGANLYANFAGGTIKAAANLTDPISTGGGVTTISTIFGAINNTAAVGNASQNFAGGMKVDTNGFDVTYTNDLLGATGNGVAQGNIAITGGSGYIGAPTVTFTGGTLAPNGTPASGYAIVNGGAVTGIVITSPGEYTVAPTVALSGGGGTGASVALSGLTPNSADAGLTIMGAGSLNLTGSSSYVGPTNVNAGKLLINGNNSAATGAVNVSALASLGGSGTVGGLTTVASTGIVAPGNSAGNLTFAAGANLSAGGVYSWELGALSTANAGTDFDLITVSGGNLALGGTSALTLDFGLISATDPNSADAFWTTAQTWKIIDVTAGTNTGNTNLSTITNASYSSGSFTTTVGTGADAGDIFLVFTPVVGGPSVWQGANNDNWTAAGSWTGSVPNSITAEAKFVTAGGTTAILDANQTVNKLTFDATAPHTISGASTLTLAGTTPVISTAGTNTATQTVAVNLDLAAGTAINVQGGTLELNSPANAVLGTGVTATVANGATLSLGGAGNALSNGGSTHANVANSGTLAATTPGKRVGNIDGTGTTTVTAANATLTANHVRQATLNIGAGNTVTIASNGTDTATSVVTNLSINATGKLDLDNNDLIVPNGNLTTLTAQLATGLDINGNYGGGPGITSSAFSSNMDFNTVLGIAANSDLGYMSFSGQAVGNNDVLIKYTYYGDADLSGSVDTSTDFDLYITGLTSGGSLGGWLFGDFDYSGTVDSSTDFDLYITGLTSQGSPLLTAGGGGNLVQAVPEPSTFVLGGLALLGFAGVGLRRRRLASQAA